MLELSERPRNVEMSVKEVEAPRITTPKTRETVTLRKRLQGTTRIEQEFWVVRKTPICTSTKDKNPTRKKGVRIYRIL